MDTYKEIKKITRTYTNTCVTEKVTEKSSKANLYSIYTQSSKI